MVSKEKLFSVEILIELESIFDDRSPKLAMGFEVDEKDCDSNKGIKLSDVVRDENLFDPEEMVDVDPPAALSEAINPDRPSVLTP